MKRTQPSKVALATQAQRQHLGMDVEALYARTYAFRRQYFPNQFPQAAALKVLEEANELVDASAGDKSPTVSHLEAADVLITLLGWCHASRISIGELVALGHAKMIANEQRDWVMLPDGRAKHVESE